MTNVNSEHLTRLLNGDLDVWSPTELGAIWRHLLRSPLNHVIRSAKSGGNEPNLTVGDLLLREPSRCDDLDRLATFTRANANNAESRLPSPITRMVLALVAVFQSSDTSQPPARVAESVIGQHTWAVSQSWLDAETRARLQRIAIKRDLPAQAASPQ